MTKKTGKIVKCDYCGEEVYRNSNMLKTYKRHFCSNKCYYKWRKGKYFQIKTGKIVKCENCGKEIWRRHYRLKNYKHHFCSRECHHIWERDKPNPKLSETLKRLYREGKIKPWNRGKKHPQFSGKNNPMYGKYHTEDTKRKMSLAKKGKYHTEDTKRKLSLTNKELWKNPEFKEKKLKAMLKGLFKSPTSLEKQYIKLFKKYNLPFNYVGNGKLIIDGRNPDFVESNGKKIVIDVRHTKVCEFMQKITHEQYKARRIKHFAKNGWKCLLFFETGLEDERKIVEEIRKLI